MQWDAERRLGTTLRRVPRRHLTARQLERPITLGPAYADADLVFATAAGRPLNPNNVLRTFAALVRTAGVPRELFHDLRHRQATWLLKVEQPVKVVSERLGHAKSSITLDTDAHVLPDMQDDAVEALGALLFRRPARPFGAAVTKP